MSQLAVAQQLRTLASDPDNQSFIVNEKECMNGLLSFLDSADSEVVIVSLQALQFLSTDPSNQETLAAFPGLLLKLSQLTDCDDPLQEKIASSTLDNLQSYVNRDHDRPVKESFKPRYLHEFSLQIRNMVTIKDRTRVEGCLIALEGIVSVTIDKVHQRCTIYSNVPESEIFERTAAAIRAQGFALEGDPEESSDPGLPDGGKGQAPPKQRCENSYLQPSVAHPSSAAASAAGGNHPGYLDGKANSVVLYGGIEQNSLQARYARRKRQEQQEQEKKGAVRSLFGAVSSYFW